MRTIFFFLIAFLLPYLALAEVYKWVDEEGNVHYGDRPSANADETAETFDASKANASFVEQDDNQYHQKKLLEIRESERVEQKTKKEKEKKSRAIAKRKCHIAKDRLNSMKNSRYIYNLDKNGERIVYSKKQRAAATAKWQARVDKFCQ